MKKTKPKPKRNLHLKLVERARRDELIILGSFTVFDKEFFIVNEKGFYKIAKLCDSCEDLATLEIENCSVPVTMPIGPFMHFALDFMMGHILFESLEKDKS